MALSLTFIVAVRVPVAPGVKVTEIVQVDVADNCAGKMPVPVRVTLGRVFGALSFTLRCPLPHA